MRSSFVVERAPTAFGIERDRALQSSRESSPISFSDHLPSKTGDKGIISRYGPVNRHAEIARREFALSYEWHKIDCSSTVVKHSE